MVPAVAIGFVFVIRFGGVVDLLVSFRAEMLVCLSAGQISR